MFYLLATMASKTPARFQAVLENESHIWHCRFGHLSYKGLKMLSDKKMVEGFPFLKTPEKLCTNCLTGKQHQKSIPNSLQRAAHKLQLVHSDICKPITPILNNNKRYILSFVDDFTRKTKIYFLYKKLEAFVMFKVYKACVKKEEGMNITCLRTDRGGEFTSNEFEEFCITHGISKKLTVSYTPQQNGVAERKKYDDNCNTPCFELQDSTLYEPINA